MVTSLFLAAVLALHPLHTTVTEITFSGRAVRVVSRVFEDDLARDDAGAVAYAQGSLGLRTGAGVPVALHGCGVRREGGLAWLCLEGAMEGPTGLRMRNRLLCDRYGDQVNIVQVVRNSGLGKGTTLFTTTDGEKELR